MKTILQNRTSMITLATFVAVVLVVVFADMASAQSLAEKAQEGVNAVSGGGETTDLGEIIKKVINFLLFTIGVLSVIMIIIGGIRYVVSGGDPGATKSARDTILYAIIGLVVAFVAYGIVNFFTGLFS